MCMAPYKPDDSWRFVFLGVLTVAIMALRPGGIVLRSTVAAVRFRIRRRRTAAPIEAAALSAGAPLLVDPRASARASGALP